HGVRVCRGRPSGRPLDGEAVSEVHGQPGARDLHRVSRDAAAGARPRRRAQTLHAAALGREAMGDRDRARECTPPHLTLAPHPYRLPRGETKGGDIAPAPASGSPFKAPVTSYFPY